MSLIPAKTAADSFFDTLGTGIKDSWDKYSAFLQKTLGDPELFTVETKDSSGASLYLTRIQIAGSVSNQFNVAKPDANDEYWKRHNAMVDETLQIRNQLVMKMLDAVGAVFKIPI